MRCPKCGANVPDGKSKCPYCFSPLNAYSEPVSSRSSYVSPSPAYQNQRPAPQKSVSDIYDRNIGGVVLINNPEGTGTGCLITNDGLILTNSHMVYCEEQNGFYAAVEVIINNVSYRGELLHANLPDGDNDVALVKVEGTFNNALKFGDSSTLRNGDEVIAIGNSLGMGMSVARGIVSDLRKNVSGSILITSDVATNHGNSGGPLFNTRGEVIAICVSGMDGAKGMNFFIPINRVLDILAAWGYKF